MSEFRISDFSQKVQDYIRANNIDENGDGVIKGAELENLLAGCEEARNEIGDTAKLSGPKKVNYNPMDVLRAIENVENYNQESPEFRQEVVDSAIASRTAKLNELSKTINENVEKLGQLFDPDFISTQMALPMGGTLDLSFFTRRSSIEVRDFISSLNNGLDSFISDSETAFLHFNGDFNLNRYETVDYHTTLRNMGYSSLNDLTKAAAEECLAKLSAGDYQPYSNILIQFKENVINDNQNFAASQKEYYTGKRDAYAASFETSKEILQSTIENGISTEAIENAKTKFNNTGWTFYHHLGEEMGLDSPTTDSFFDNMAISTATSANAPEADVNAAPKAKKIVCKYNGEPTVLAVVKENGVIKSATTLDGVAVDPRNIK